MARTAFNAPAHRILQRSALGTAAPGNAPCAAPSADYGGQILQDPRLQWNTANSATGAQVIGWSMSSDMILTDQVPSTISNVNIAVAAALTSGTAMTLVSSTGAGITVLGSAQIIFPNIVSIPSGSLAIDGLPGFVQFGMSPGDITGAYDPTKGISRAVSITATNGGAAGGTFVVKGADWYGSSMTENIVHAGGATTKNGKKAFKFVFSVTPQFTDAQTYSVGTADIYGFNIGCDFLAYTNIYWNNVLATSSGFTAAVTTTATATTGDVRGTYATGSASDGTKRLQIGIAPSLSRLSTSPMSTGLFGVAQF